MAAVCSLPLTAFAAEATYRALSTDGLYRLTAIPEFEPVSINRLHRWTLALETADGEPVSAAELTLTGGMPEHNHGLPTQPRITECAGEGEYLLEGMRFHMPGTWELVVDIEAGPGNDTVILSFEL